MEKGKDYTEKVILAFAKRNSIDISKFDMQQLKLGMSVEMEHGSEMGFEVDVTNDEPDSTLKIVLAHLKKEPKYYTKILKNEKDSEDKK